VADLYGLFLLTPVLVEGSEAVAVEGARVSGFDVSLTVFDESREICLITTILKMNLSELKIFRLFGEAEGRAA
jgi:hypothetical protein